MGNILTAALLGIILSPVVHTYEAEKQVNLSEHPESVLCNCVEYTRLYRPDIPSMDAGSFAVATTTPSVGAVAKMRYSSGAFHVAYVADVKDGEILLYHANVIPCQESTEWRDVNDWRILGYL